MNPPTGSRQAPDTENTKGTESTEKKKRLNAETLRSAVVRREE